MQIKVHINWFKGEGNEERLYIIVKETWGSQDTFVKIWKLYEHSARVEMHNEVVDLSFVYF